MKPHSPSNWIYAAVVTLAFALFVTVTGWLLAAPIDDITRAVTGSGATSVEQATPDAFLDALASLLIGLNKANSTPYLDAAAKLRPDLKGQIADTATAIYSPSDASQDPDRRRVSKNRRRCTICHRPDGKQEGKTLRLPCKAAESHLRNHPRDTRGPCPAPR